jgi:hypothetical protein
LLLPLLSCCEVASKLLLLLRHQLHQLQPAAESKASHLRPPDTARLAIVAVSHASGTNFEHAPTHAGRSLLAACQEAARIDPIRPLASSHAASAAS